MKFKPSIRVEKKGDVSHSKPGMVVSARWADLPEAADNVGFTHITITEDGLKKRKYSVSSRSLGQKSCCCQ